MTTLIDGFTDSLDHILSAEAIEPELDAKGNVKPIKWKMSLEDANNGVVASATVGGRKYDVYANDFRVTVTKVKDVTKTPEELVKASPVVRKEDEQFPGLKEKAIEAVKTSAIKDNDTKFSNKK